MKRSNGIGRWPTPYDLGQRLRFGFAAVATLAAFASSGLGACAASDETTISEEPERNIASVGDSGADASADGDAAVPCAADCEYFPPACSADVLCSNGLFDPNKPTGGPDHLDMRMTVQLIRGRSANDVWVLGGLGAQRHFDGTSWVRSELPASEISPMGLVPGLQTLWLRDTSEIGFNGVQTSSRSYSRGLVDPPDGGLGSDGWTEHAPPSLVPAGPFKRGSQRVTFGWSSPGSDWFWLATGKTSLVLPNPPALIRVRVADAGVFAGEVKVLDAGSFMGMHGVSADDFWAVGMDGAAVRVTGGSGASPTFKHYNSRTRNALYGVWAASASDVWAVGFNGTVRHYTGDPLLWEVVSDVPAGVHLNAIWGTSASDIWAVGNEAVVLHYDGIRWSRVKIGGLGLRRPNLTTVWASDSEHVWIGGEGVVLSLGGKP